MAVLIRWAGVEHLDADHSPSWLTASGRSRLASLRQRIDRQHFVGARLLLRRTLVEAIGCAEDDVVLRQECARCGGPHGRPVVRIEGSPAPHVSFAHSGGLAMVGLADRPLGVDLEAADRPGPEPTCDLRTWVRTEAVLKATGHGLDVDPRLVGLSEPDAAPRLVSWRGPGRRPVVRLADVEIDAGDGFVACVARIGRAPIRLDAHGTDIRG